MNKIVVNLSERAERELTTIGAAILAAGIEFDFPTEDGMLSQETFDILRLLGIATDGDGFSKVWLTEVLEPMSPPARAEEL